MSRKDSDAFGTLRVITTSVAARLWNPSVKMEVFQVVPVLELTTRSGTKLRTKPFASQGEARRAKPDVYEAMADVLGRAGMLECPKCGHSMEGSTCDRSGRITGMTSERLATIRVILAEFDGCGIVNCSNPACVAIELLDYIDAHAVDPGGFGDEIERLQGMLAEEAAARHRVTTELASLREHVKDVLRDLSGGRG